MSAPDALAVGSELQTLNCSRCPAIFTTQVTLVNGRAWPDVPAVCDTCRGQEQREVRETADARARTTAVRIEADRRERAVDELAIPPKYVAASLESFASHGSLEDRTMQTTVRRLVARYVADWPKVEPLLVFRGEPGTGKGHMVWTIAKHLVGEARARVRIVKLGDLVRQLRASWRDPEPDSEERVLRYFRGLDLLVIDEVSRHAFYGQQIHQHLYDVIDHRIEWERPTILTSNDTDEGLAEILRPALRDRLDGEGGIVEFGSASWRARPREMEAPG